MGAGLMSNAMRDADTAAATPRRLQHPQGSHDAASRSVLSILQQHALRILIGFFTIGAIAVISYFQISQRNIVDKAAIQRAHDFSRSLEEFRTLYTSEIVGEALAHGLEVTHDYDTRESAIPLPATLSMLLGERIGAEGGAGSRLYSEYPFPWRETTGGLRDEFDREAWRRLKEDPDRPFYRFSEMDGQRVLRYATADIMRSACVGCHNGHPVTPKNDWRTGDVRGVLEVTVPMEVVAAEASHSMVGGYILTGFLGCLGIGGLLLFAATESRQRKAIEEKRRELVQTVRSLDTEATERRRVEARLKVIFNASPYGLIAVDRNGTIVQASAETKNLLGYDREQLLGEFISSFLPELFPATDTAQDFCHRSSEASRTESGRELEVRRKGGSSVSAEVSLSPFEIEGHPHVLVCLVDITARKQVELQLRQAQKMESIGQLAAGIAHEINTPTQFVGDNVQFLQQTWRELQSVFDLLPRAADELSTQTPPSPLAEEFAAALDAADLAYVCEEVPQAVAQSLDGVKRVAQIVRAMKEFSHPGAESKTAVDLNRAVETTVTVARNEWKYVAEVETDLAPDLPPVPCLPGEINQVLLNLLVNAAHAIADVIGAQPETKGSITLRTRQVDEWVEIRVEDTGRGIPPEIQDRIFEPFFTTKDVGKGTGQGLALAHTVVVRKHGGQIRCESTPDEGATFVVRLPLHEEPGDAEAAA